MKYLLFGLFCVISACSKSGGGGGGNSYAAVPKIFNDDLKTIENVSYSSKPVPSDSGSSILFSRAFVNDGSPAAFVRERIRLPYAEEVLMEMRLAEKNHLQNSITLRQFLGKQQQKDSKFRVASNYGVAIWSAVKYQGFDVVLINGSQKIDVDSPHIGLVGFTKNFLKNLSGSNEPVESRISIYVHEARHSDCPTTESATTGCGYPHIICPQEHEMAGLPACDDLSWGSYAFGGIYLNYMKYKYPEKSEGYRRLDFYAADQYSRLTTEALHALATENPNFDTY